MQDQLKHVCAIETHEVLLTSTFFSDGSVCVCVRACFLPYRLEQQGFVGHPSDREMYVRV